MQNAFNSDRHEGASIPEVESTDTCTVTLDRRECKENAEQEPIQDLRPSGAHANCSGSFRDSRCCPLPSSFRWMTLWYIRTLHAHVPIYTVRTLARATSRSLYCRSLCTASILCYYTTDASSYEPWYNILATNISTLTSFPQEDITTLTKP